MPPQPFHAVDAQLRRQVLVVGLVQHDQHALGHAAQECLDLVRPGEGARRVIGIRGPDDVGLVIHRTRHRFEVVAIVHRRHDDGARTARLCRQRIDRERVLRHYRGTPGSEEGERHELEHVVRAVAEHDRWHLDAIAPGKRLLQLEAVAIRVARDLRERRVDRRARPRADAARILVRGQLDDGFLVHPHLARQLRDGLARLVRRDRAHVGRRKLAGIDEHQRATG